ncbi:hypothetical protein MJ579_10590 [Klebsiella pneumoniae]|nr:hypothetical protein MJ579_10590 [Klebsiella pneumoniae]
MTRSVTASTYALKVKDAIVDSFTCKNLPRPNVDRESPDLRINVWLNKETAHISLIWSGEGLHLRGYRDGARNGADQRKSRGGDRHVLAGYRVRRRSIRQRLQPC